ncbi:transcription factor HES-5-like [Ambystoma mexicanum]|uniref:transcription factor HES-5-like n=1 Tax=Ambystoma mexicanum TaxID=8296 RepID=UPI0037E7B7E0
MSYCGAGGGLPEPPRVWETRPGLRPTAPGAWHGYKCRVQTSPPRVPARVCEIKEGLLGAGTGPEMPPSSSNTLSVETPLSNEKNKLRKPAVEKVRRHRINSCIEQLRLLLQAEFQSQQSNSRPEKADILEVAVRCLQQRCLSKSQVPCPKSLEQGFGQGYLRCLRQSVQFLSYCQTSMGAPSDLIKHFDQTQLIADSRHNPQLAIYSQPSRQCITPPLPSQAQWKPSEPNTNRLWRPW